MLALVTGAGSGMGVEITRSLLKAGYRVIMACQNTAKGMAVRDRLEQETGIRGMLEVRGIDLASLENVSAFANGLLRAGERIDLLMNNAGSLRDVRCQTADGLEYNVSVNYVGPYLLTRKLLPLMGPGSRIVNMASLVYRFGRFQFPEFFTQGKRGGYNRFAVYSNSKLAITLFTLDLAERLRDRGITVNASDPGIVSTDIIRMNNKVIDTLCDVFFRPLIYTPAQGAATATDLLLNPEKSGTSGTFNKRCHPVKLSQKYLNHSQMAELWNRTEEILGRFLINE